MLWVVADPEEAQQVCRLMLGEGLTPDVRYRPARGTIRARWVVVARVEDMGKERRLRERLETLLPRDWS